MLCKQIKGSKGSPLQGCVMGLIEVSLALQEAGAGFQQAVCFCAGLQWEQSICLISHSLFSCPYCSSRLLSVEKKLWSYKSTGQGAWTLACLALLMNYCGQGSALLFPHEGKKKEGYSEGLISY